MLSPEVIQVGGLLLILTAIGIKKLRVDECLQCSHCQAEKRRRAEEQKHLRKEYDERWGLKGRDDKKDEDP